MPKPDQLPFGHVEFEMYWLKKKKMHKLQVLLGVKWGLRLGDSVSDSSEKLLQRGSGGRSVYVILVKGEFNEMKHLS